MGGVGGWSVHRGPAAYQVRVPARPCNCVFAWSEKFAHWTSAVAQPQNGTELTGAVSLWPTSGLFFFFFFPSRPGSPTSSTATLRDVLAALSLNSFFPLPLSVHPALLLTLPSSQSLRLGSAPG